MRNISSWAIRNPVFPFVLFAALTLLGLVSFMRMDVNDNPDIEFPAALVAIAQPGAAPTEMETQVTQRVEAAVRGINGVDEITSTVGEGSSTTFVQFVIGTPVDRGVNDVRDAVANIRSDLPEGILEPNISRVDIAGGPLGIYSAETSDMVAMVAGMLPIALSFTGDGSWRAPMGVVVIGGLILSTVLSLIIVPAGFSLADSFEQGLGSRLRRVLTYRPEDGEPRRAPQPAE